MELFFRMNKHKRVDKYKKCFYQNWFFLEVDCWYSPALLSFGFVFIIIFQSFVMVP